MEMRTASGQLRRAQKRPPPTPLSQPTTHCHWAPTSVPACHPLSLGTYYSVLTCCALSRGPTRVPACCSLSLGTYPCVPAHRLLSLDTYHSA